MASLNKVLLIGRLTRDPEKRSTPSGMTVAELGVAVNRRYRASNGEDREETCFVNVTVWGKQAEACAEYLRKGSPLFVEGRLKLDEWEKDGQKRSKLGVVAERVQFLEGGGQGKRGPIEYGDAPAEEPAAPRSGAARPPPATADDAEPDDLPF
jgi:single-strand DNA-binding protein